MPAPRLGITAGELSLTYHDSNAILTLMIYLFVLKSRFMEKDRGRERQRKRMRELPG